MLTRIMGLILAAVAVQFVMSGIKEAFKSECFNCRIWNFLKLQCINHGRLEEQRWIGYSTHNHG